MKKGDYVNYSGRKIGEAPATHLKIESIMPRGEIFNQNMASVEGIDHWVPCSDLTLSKKEEQQK